MCLVYRVIIDKYVSIISKYIYIYTHTELYRGD